MRVAELFVNLGLSGADKVSAGLGTIKNNMLEVGTVAAGITAGITAAVYAFKKLSAESNQTGQELTQFSNLTGLSADKLQRWQQLALKSGESADELMGNVKSLQDTMNKLVTFGQAPQGLTGIANSLQSMGKPLDRSKFRDTFYMLDKLREYAKGTKDAPDVANGLLKSFGLSDNMVQALRTSKFDLNKSDSSRMYSPEGIRQLNAMKVKWDELGSSIEHAIGKLNIRFGPALLKDLTALTTQVFKLAEALGTLIIKLHVIEGVGKVVSGWTQLSSLVTDMLDPKKRSQILPNSDTLANLGRDALGSILGPPPAAGGTKSTSITTNISIDGDGKNGAQLGAEIASHVNKIVNDSMRQLPQAGNGGGY